MKAIAIFFAEYTIWVVFHIAMFSAFLTGFFMAYTAGDLGPLAPVMISIGICVMLFSSLAEFLFLVRRVLASAARYYLNKSSEVPQ